MCPSSPLIERGFLSSSHLESQMNPMNVESKSTAIPMPETHIHRTESELQLYEDMAAAEYRDRCMFNRLVTGIQRRKQLHYDRQLHSESQNDILGNVDAPTSPSFTNQPMSIYPPLILGTDQTTEDIISARCEAIAIAAAAPAVNDPMTSNNTNVMNVWRDKRSMPRNEVQSSQEDVDDGWAIEGFDSPRSELHVHHHLIEDEDNDHSHHVFDIEI